MYLRTYYYIVKLSSNFEGLGKSNMLSKNSKAKFDV